MLIITMGPCFEGEMIFLILINRFIRVFIKMLSRFNSGTKSIEESLSSPFLPSPQISPAIQRSFYLLSDDCGMLNEKYVRREGAKE